MLEERDITAPGEALIERVGLATQADNLGVRRASVSTSARLTLAARSRCSKYQSLSHTL